jgi:hypothetical protein
MFDEPDGERSLQTERLMCNTPFSRDAQDFPVGVGVWDSLLGENGTRLVTAFQKSLHSEDFYHSRPRSSQRDRTRPLFEV